MKKYFAIKNKNGRYLKVRTGSNGSGRAWVKTIKSATIFAEGQAKAAVEDLKNSPYYDGITIVSVGEAESAWMTKLNKFVTMKVVDTYSGRAIALRVEKQRYENAEGWDWLSDYQRKRIEDFFGPIQAYHCKVFTPDDVEYDAYYAENGQER